MRILILNLGAASAAEVSNALTGQGYELAVEGGLNVEQVESASPELLITEATPSDLSCCGLITQIKSREQTKSVRILMLVQGGALERARALDLGADDVVSCPFEPVFAARVRTQFRERLPEEELRNKLKRAEEKNISPSWPSIAQRWRYSQKTPVGTACDFCALHSCGGRGSRYFLNLPSQPNRYPAAEVRSRPIEPRRGAAK
jgi:CheY-like chemotaxis protein